VQFFAAQPTPPLFEDTLPLLETLATGPWQLGVITQRPRNGAVRFLSDHALLDRFAVIIAGDDGHGRKPNPAPFQRALRMMGRPAERAIFVGDRIDDDCGGACGAGLRAFLIDRQQLYAGKDLDGFDYSFTRLTSLLELLDHLPSLDTLESN
jgi:putative hydrolase of the HAD superfamily